MDYFTDNKFQKSKKSWRLEVKN